MEITYLVSMKELTHRIKQLIEMLSVKLKYINTHKIQGIGDILILI